MRLVAPAKLDHQFMTGAARFFYWRLLKRGAEVYEYLPTKLHSKLIVIDDAVHIGSANFDLRSLYLNLEMMLRVEDPDFAAMMRGFVDGEIANSKRITAEEHRARHDLVEPAALGGRLVPRRDRRLQSVAAPQCEGVELRPAAGGGRRRRRLDLVLIAPEEMAGRDVHPFEALVDPAEMGRHEIARLGLELIDQEGAAGAERRVGLRGDPRADARRQGREGQAGEDIVGMLESRKRR